MDWTIGYPGRFPDALLCFPDDDDYDQPIIASCCFPEEEEEEEEEEGEGCVGEAPWRVWEGNAVVVRWRVIRG